jgi:hypothetical protein
MRIVIQIEGENVVVKTDRQYPETQPPETQLSSVVDAGPVPAELVNQFGRVRESGSANAYEQSGKSPSSRRKGESVEPETALNPLRAGEAAARRYLAAEARPIVQNELIETTDAGKAPRLPKVARNEKGSKRSRRKA